MSNAAFFFLRLNDHIQYLKKIQMTIEGKGEFTGTSFQDCKLGKWLYGTGPAEASAVSTELREIFDTLLEPHELFHNTSHEAVKKSLEGDKKGAELHVTQMHKLSTTLVNILLKLDARSHQH